MEDSMQGYPAYDDSVGTIKSYTSGDYHGEAQQWVPTYTHTRTSHLWFEYRGCYQVYSVNTEKIVIYPHIRR